MTISAMSPAPDIKIIIWILLTKIPAQESSTKSTKCSWKWETKSWNIYLKNPKPPKIWVLDSLQLMPVPNSHLLPRNCPSPLHFSQIVTMTYFSTKVTFLAKISPKNMSVGKIYRLNHRKPSKIKKYLSKLRLWSKFPVPAKIVSPTITK